MWLGLLIGVGLGVLALGFILIRQERRYRLLFSDTHLEAFAAALLQASDGASHATFEGLSVHFARGPKHELLCITTRRPLAQPAAAFLLAFADALLDPTRRGVPVTHLASPRSATLVWAAPSSPLTLDDHRPNHGRSGPTPAAPAARPTLPDAAQLAALRAQAADHMRTLVLAQGTPEAFL